VRRRQQAATLEPRAGGGSEPARVDAGQAAVALVDDALGEYSSRELVNRVDALGRLRGVELATHDLASGPRVVEIVGDADRAWAETQVVSQVAVLDVLLDLRSALTA
jgi:hypothetical protein